MSVFGTGAFDMKEIGLNQIKIPSHETTNLKLIEYCSNNFDYIYFSAGASTSEEIIEANKILKAGKASTLLCIVFHHIPVNQIALIFLVKLVKELHNSIGYSDHTGSTLIPSIAVGLGAKVIEKHFTTDKTFRKR